MRTKDDKFRMKEVADLKRYSSPTIQKAENCRNGCEATAGLSKTETDPLRPVGDLRRPPPLPESWYKERILKLNDKRCVALSERNGNRTLKGFSVDHEHNSGNQ